MLAEFTESQGWCWEFDFWAIVKDVYL